MPLQFESLHNHTTRSDGQETYLELLATAEANDFKVIAFTDHDSLPSNTDLAQLQGYRGPVQWHIGCELTSGWPKELGGGPANMFHIAGLFVDPANPALRDHCRQATQARLTRMEQIVQNLKGLGFTISVDDCLSASGGESVGRPHIVKAVLSHPQNQKIIEDIKAQMASAAKQDAKIKKQYEEILSFPEARQPYLLFLDKAAFIPGVYVDYLYFVDMDTSVQLIRGAGGIAILAHWWTIKQKLTLAEVGAFIANGRLDGIEVASSFSGAHAQEDEAAMKALADQLGCIQTVGIDAHRPEDFANFLRTKPKAAQLSVGQTRRILGRLEKP